MHPALRGKLCTDYTALVNFISYKSIFQSELFAQFQQKIPYREKTFFIEVEDCGEKLRALEIRGTVAKKLHWLWVPYGPTIESKGVRERENKGGMGGKGGPGTNKKLAVKFLKALETIARQEKSVFTRIEPGAHTPPELIAEIKAQTKPHAPHARYTPDHTLVLDLSLTDEEILKQMKPKGRYNIKVAQKNGVLIKQYNQFKEIPEADFEAWYEIMKETGERDGFGTHRKGYYFNLLSTLGPKDESSLFVAYNANNEVIGGAIVTYHDRVGMYFYGASTYKHRALMAPYLVQWAAILESRRRGCAYYDFLGVSPPNSPKHHWAGVTDFKEKFGGERVAYAPAFEIVHRPFVYRLLGLRKVLSDIAKKIRR